METMQLAAAGVRYQALRGLLLVPVGAVFIGCGLFNMPPIGDEPVSGYGWWFAGLLVVAGIAGLVINHSTSRISDGSNRLGQPRQRSRSTRWWPPR